MAYLADYPILLPGNAWFYLTVPDTDRRCPKNPTTEKRGWALDHVDDAGRNVFYIRSGRAIFLEVPVDLCKSNHGRWPTITQLRWAPVVGTEGPIQGTDGPVRGTEGPAAGTNPLLNSSYHLDYTRSSYSFICWGSCGCSKNFSDYETWPDLTSTQQSLWPLHVRGFSNAPWRKTCLRGLVPSTSLKMFFWGILGAFCKGKGAPLVRYVCTTWEYPHMFFTEMCPLGGTNYVSFELLWGIFKGPGEGRRGHLFGAVPLQNPQVTSRKARFQQTRVYPYPLGAGSARPNPKMGAPDPEDPLFLGFPVLRGRVRPWSQTMVSDRGLGRGPDHYGAEKARKTLSHKNSVRSPRSPVLPVGYPDKKIYVPWVPRIAHKSLTPGLPVGRPPRSPEGSPAKKIYVYVPFPFLNHGVGVDPETVMFEKCWHDVSMMQHKTHINEPGSATAPVMCRWETKDGPHFRPSGSGQKLDAVSKDCLGDSTFNHYWETDFLPLLVLTRRGCSTGENRYW